MQRTEDQPEARASRWRGPGTFAGGVIAGVATAVLSTVAISAIRGCGDAPPLRAQLEREIGQAARHGRHPVATWRGDLHGTGSPSQLLVFRSNSYREMGYHGPSDELRIYDLVEGRLRRRFQFQPDRGWIFRVIAVRDLDRDGRAEIIGSIQSNPAARALMLPVAVWWDGSRYRLTALIREAPFIHTDWGGNLARGAVQRLHVLRDPVEGLTVRGYLAHALAVEDVAPYGVPTLLAGYIAKSRLVSYGDTDYLCPDKAVSAQERGACVRWVYGVRTLPTAYELHAWKLTFAGSRLLSTECLGSRFLIAARGGEPQFASARPWIARLPC